MEEGHEEEVATQESTRGGARPQGRTGQEPQWPPSVTRAPQANLIAVVALIRARFGALAIGLGDGGIRYSSSALR
jgi:hypothetical protein